MSSETKVPAEVQRLLDALPSSTRALALAVRKLVLATLPGDVIELADAKARVIGYGYGTGYRDMVATLILSKAGVKLGLAHGASLPDPSGLLEGSGKVHRYVAFTDLAHVGRPAVKTLLRSGLAAWRKRSAGGA